MVTKHAKERGASMAIDVVRRLFFSIDSSQAIISSTHQRANPLYHYFFFVSFLDAVLATDLYLLFVDSFEDTHEAAC